MQGRERLSNGVEQMIANSYQRNSIGIAANKKCSKCGSQWWEEHKALLRDINRGGATSKFNPTTFIYFKCVSCGNTEFPEVNTQGSREDRLQYSDFIKTMTNKGSPKDEAKQMSDPNPGEALEKIAETIIEKKTKKVK